MRNYRKDFLTWLEKNKGLSKSSARKIMWDYDIVHLVTHVFTIGDVDQLNKINTDGKFDLYNEFLVETVCRGKIENVENEAINGMSKIADSVNEDSRHEENKVFELKGIESAKNANETPNEAYIEDAKGSRNQLDNDTIQIVERNPGSLIDNKSDEISLKKIEISGETYSENVENASKDNSVIAGKKIIEKKYTQPVDSEALESIVVESEYEKRESVYRKINSESYVILENLSDRVLLRNTIRLNDKKNKNDIVVSPSLVFDIVTGLAKNLAMDGTDSSMVSYVAHYVDDQIKIFKRNENAFYYTEQPTSILSVNNPFDLMDVNNHVIQDSIIDTAEELSSSISADRILCLVPDSLGDFKDIIKRQIKSSGKNVIQIPRSIAAVYAFVKDIQLQDEHIFMCYDFDAEEVCRTQVKILYNEETKGYDILRMGRKKFSPSEKMTSKSLCSFYLDEYEKEYGIEIPEPVKHALISSRDIYNVIRDRKSVFYSDDSGYYNIQYDESIINDIISEICNEIQEDCIDTDCCQIILSEVYCKNDAWMNFDRLCSGITIIKKLIDDHQTIWKEYLPELSLEVIRNGMFDNLQLVDKDMFQSISDYTMDEDMEIHLEDGRLIFAEGLDHIYLPLTREDFGNTAKDKMALFDDKNVLPLNDEIEATLKLTYHYGDPDSYRLIATSIDGEIQIESRWDDLDMGNDKFPEYIPQKGKPMISEEDVDKAIKMFYKELSHPYQFRTSTNNGVTNIPFKQTVGMQWNAFWPLGKIRLAIPSMFAPDEIENHSKAFLSEIADFIKKLYNIYLDCENGTLMCENENNSFCDLAPKHLGYIQGNIINYISLFSGLFSDDVGVLTKTLRKAIVKTVANANLVGNKPSESMYSSTVGLLQLSTHLSRTEDSFNIWKYVDNRMEIVSNNDALLENVLRSIAAISWRNQEWIYQFFENNMQLVNQLTEFSIDYLNREWDWHCKNSTKLFNPRPIRDIFEAILGITRLKEYDKSILDCNKPETKEIVALAKKIDCGIRELVEYERCSGKQYLKHPFVSRIEMNVPERLKNVSSVVYPIIEILTDGTAVKLTGFHEE